MNSDQQRGLTHHVSGVESDTAVSCSITGVAYGPGSDGEELPNFCPYCGHIATDGSHRIDPDIDEVFCDRTTMSTWRYCPGCGEGVENAE